MLDIAGLPSLPVEIHELVLQQSHCQAIAALARAGKIANVLATPYLYRKVALRNNRQILRLLHTLLERDALVVFVQHLELAWSPDSPGSGTFASQMQRVLPRLSNLAHFSVSRGLVISPWFFNDITLPALHQLHVYSGVNLGFVTRHPHIRELTIYMSQFGFGKHQQANLLAPKVLRILDGGIEELGRLCSDGLPRPTLRRVDLAHNGRHVAAEAVKARDIASSVRQVNYVGGFSGTSPPLEPCWLGVERVGVRVHSWDTSRIPGNATIKMNDLAKSFPNFRTLDLILDVSLEAAVKAVAATAKQLQGVLQVQILVGAGQVYRRATPTGQLELTDEHADSPDVESHLS